MKVLFVTNWYPGEDTPYMGVFIKRHLAAIQKQDVDVKLLVIRISKGNSILTRSIKKIDDHGIELLIESFFWKFIYLFYPIQRLLLLKFIEKIYKDERFSLVHGNITHPCGVLSHALSKKMNIPFVLTEHHSQVNRLSHHWLIGRSIKATFREAQLVMPVSSSLERTIKDCEPCANTIVVPNIVDSDTFHFDNVYEENDSEKVILAVSTWINSSSNTKRPRLIIEALNDYAMESKLKIVLNHVGSCNIKDELTNLITAKNLRVNFLGRKNADEVNELLNKSSILAHATERETFSLVGPEAQKAGVPVLISKILPITDIVNSYGSVFVDNTVDDWKNGFREILSNNYNRRLIADETRHLYTMSSIGAEIVYQYKQVLLAK